MKSLRRLAVLLFFASAGSSSSAAPLYYSVVPVAGNNSNAYGINSQGDVTGVFRTQGGADHAFMFTQDNGFLDLGSLSGGNSIGRAINNGRHVVGQSDGVAFRYSPSNGMVALDTVSSDARDVNSGNAAFGVRYGVSSDTTVGWTSLNTPVPLFTSESTEGYAINGPGERVGRTDGGLLGYYSDGSSNSTFTSLGLFLPTDINDHGFVAGSEESVASIYSAGTNTYLPLGKLSPSDAFSDALSINDNNAVVGVSGSVGFLWTQADGMQNLNSLLAPGFESWTVLSANGINDNGWITGQVRFNGEDRAAILMPYLVPEPSSIEIITGPFKIPYRIYQWARGTGPFAPKISPEEERAALEQAKVTIHALEKNTAVPAETAPQLKKAVERIEAL